MPQYDDGYVQQATSQAEFMKVKQHWDWVEKSVAHIKRRVYSYGNRN